MSIAPQWPPMARTEVCPVKEWTITAELRVATLRSITDSNRGIQHLQQTAGLSRLTDIHRVLHRSYSHSYPQRLRDYSHSPPGCREGLVGVFDSGQMSGCPECGGSATCCQTERSGPSDQGSRIHPKINPRVGIWYIFTNTSAPAPTRDDDVSRETEQGHPYRHRRVSPDPDWCPYKPGPQSLSPKLIHKVIHSDIHRSIHRRIHPSIHRERERAGAMDGSGTPPPDHIQQPHLRLRIAASRNLREPDPVG